MRMFLIGCQKAWPIGTKLDTRIHLVTGIVLRKSKSMSESHSGKNGDAIGAERNGD